MKKELITELKIKWENYFQPHGFPLNEALSEYNGFHHWWNSQDNKKLSLKQYTSLVSDGDSFTHWMERKTEKCGKFRTASSYAYGIYRVKTPAEPPVYKNREHKRNENNAPLNKESAEKYFGNVVLPAFQSAQNGHVFQGERILEINFQRKIAYMFNTAEFLPIFKNQTLKNIIDFFEIKNAESSTLEASKNILSYFKKQEWITVADQEKDAIFKQTLALGLFLHEQFSSAKEYVENTILYGPPGTGKTYEATEAINKNLALLGQSKDEQLLVVQFHPSFTYEDFIEGYKPKVKIGQITLELQSGKFKVFCKAAALALKEYRKNYPTGKDYPKYYFFADEINRAELSRVFGEALVCIEQSKRFDFDKYGNAVGGLIIQTALGHEDSENNAIIWKESKAYFSVPKNVVFIGTMNSTDRSIDAFDLALRRRFSWEKMGCNYDFIVGEYFESPETGVLVKEKFKNLNKTICEDLGLGEDYEVGHAFVTNINAKLKPERVDAELSKFFADHLTPLLTEYLRGDYSSIEIKKKLKELQMDFCGAGANANDD